MVFWVFSEIKFGSASQKASEWTIYLPPVRWWLAEGPAQTPEYRRPVDCSGLCRGALGCPSWEDQAGIWTKKKSCISVRWRASTDSSLSLLRWKLAEQTLRTVFHDWYRGLTELVQHFAYGGVNIGARALLEILLVWFGKITRLSQ